ncbi:MAG: alpha/beta hydrolase family protein [Promethearchaeota archaeon]
MRKEIISINIRSEKLHSILYLPEINDLPINNFIFPLVIRINGMPGVSPEDDENRFARHFIENNMAYFTFDHQGVRESSGIFTYYDAQANIERVIDQLVQHSEINPFKIGLLGESFGGAMAFCNAVRDHRVQCLAIRSPVFDTEIIPKNPLFKYFAKYLTQNKQMRFPEGDLKEAYAEQTKQYNPNKLANKLTKPVYIIAGNKDQLFPENGFHQLFKKIKSDNKKIDIIDGADHNFTNNNLFLEMCRNLTKFFNKYLQ